MCSRPVFILLHLSFCGAFVPTLRSVNRPSSLIPAVNDDSDIMVCMNGLPGAMGKEVAVACLRRGMKLAPVALTGPSFGGTSVIVDGVEVDLVDGSDAKFADEAALRLKTAAEELGIAKLVCIDYTHPSAVKGNVEWYLRHGLDFVMGTTGGEREGLSEQALEDAGCVAVVAPNMAKQIVALQATLEGMAATYPGSFVGYDLSVTESHQASKADTSGTAKALVRALNTLTDGSEDDDALEKRIKRIRDEPGQLEFNVPKEALGGHAFHTYTLRSADGSVQFSLQHNVCGREIYAEGTADAVEYVARTAAAATEKSGSNVPKRLFNMIDVLKAGAMN